MSIITNESVSEEISKFIRDKAFRKEMLDFIKNWGKAKIRKIEISKKFHEYYDCDVYCFTDVNSMFLYNNINDIIACDVCKTTLISDEYVAIIDGLKKLDYYHLIIR